MDKNFGDLGKDAAIETNAAGGKQSIVGVAFHLTDPIANHRLARVFYEGARAPDGIGRYPRDNWRLISVEEHLNHALTHINAFLAGDKQDDHLDHALCRIHMAVAKDARPEYLGAAGLKPTIDGSIAAHHRCLRHPHHDEAPA